MFDFVRNHQRLLQFGLLVLIVPSFVAFGIQGYQSFNEGTNAAAEVAGTPISQAEWDSAHRNQVERLRAQMPTIDVKMLDTPEMRQNVLEELVRSRVMFEATQKLHLMPTDEHLARVFRTDPQFESARNPDGTVRKELLTLRGMTSEQFAQRIKLDMAQQQVLGGIGNTAIAPAGVAGKAIDALFQRREVQIARFDPKDFLAKQQAGDAEIQAWYDNPQHTAQFQSPETAAIEYVVLDLDAVHKTISVPEDDLRKYYGENAARYTQPEERRARHILVKLDPKASADDKAKARAKAESLLAELQKNRAAFAELAQKQSDDPGSAAQGGDLDWFGKGMMAAPFEDAAFKLKKGELSGIVETEFGLHLIEVTDARGGAQRSFESMRAELEAEVRGQLAQKRFTELAEQFTNMVDQETSLQPVADKFKLELRQAKDLHRTPAPNASGALANPKLLAEVFSADSLSKKQNLQALDLGGNQLVSARVLSHNPAHKQPLDEVKAKVRDAVLADKAAAAARTEGAERLKAWQADASGAKLGNAVLLSRQTQEQPRALVEAVLRHAAEPLPAWIGVDLGAQGYAVVKLNQIMPADQTALGGPARVQSQFAQVWGQAESEAYYAALRERFKVKINAKAGATAAN